MESQNRNVIKKTRLRAVQTSVGCGAILIFGTGILGIVMSFFSSDPELASTIRTRCVIGICIGIAMVVGWKIYKNIIDKNRD